MEANCILLKNGYTMKRWTQYGPAFMMEHTDKHEDKGPSLLTSIAGLVHVNEFDLTTQILVSPCHTCLVYAKNYWDTLWHFYKDWLRLIDFDERWLSHVVNSELIDYVTPTFSTKESMWRWLYFWKSVFKYNRVLVMQGIYEYLPTSYKSCHFNLWLLIYGFIYFIILSLFIVSMMR